MKKAMHTFPEQQLAWLKQEAARMGISASELLRRIIDRYREERDVRNGHNNEKPPSVRVANPDPGEGP